MKKAALYLLLINLIVITITCSKVPKKQISKEPDPAIISAYTSGIISRESTIRIRFTLDMVDESQLNRELEPSPIVFSPKIRGEALWSDPRTLEFLPEQGLQSGEDFTATVDLSQFVKDDQDAGIFSFRFSVLQQSFTIHVEGLETPSETDLGKLELHGTLTTADVVSTDEVGEALRVVQHRELHIEWTHSQNRLEHRFVVSGIIREEQPTPVLLKWDGEPIHVDQKGERTISVPSLSDFTVLEVIPIQSDEEYIRVRFSDPLKKDQDLEGFLWIKGIAELNFTINRNIASLFTGSPWPKEVTLNIEPGIRNSMGKKLKEGKTASVVFETLKPEVRFPGKGVILPTSQGLTIPIETLNLNGVIVEATRIYEDNVAQFLQINSLEGDRELRRVGKMVWKKALPVAWGPERKNQWIRTGLDLTSLVTGYPKGMYRLKVYFSPEQVEFHCTERADDEKWEVLNKNETQDEEEEESAWDYWEWEYDVRRDYYRNRENPCHPAYYMEFYDHDIAAYQNVLISDIGLIAKRGNDDSLTVAATSLKTAEPLAGVKLTAMNFQQQKIGEGTTGQDGFAMVSLTDTPFLLTAEKDNQAGYLKLDHGSALSVSHFDVGGAEIKRGLKGFIYGDRGVWRPGDPIYLTFILMDKDNPLPPGHPLHLRLINPRGQLVESMVKKESVDGFYHFPLSTNEDAPTGNWTAEISMGGVVFEKALKIETVLPNRLKMRLDFGPGRESLKSGKLQADLTATWLHGAPAKNLKAEVTVSFRSIPTRFRTHSDYTFDDPVREYGTETRSIFEGNLDTSGKGSVQAAVYAKNDSPGMLMASFRTRVFEPGGAASTDRFSLPFHPFERYVGIKAPKGDTARGMLLTDTKHKIDIAVIDVDGNPVPEAKVRAELFKIKWRWWWEKGEESLASYVGTSSFRPIESDEVEIRNGIGAWYFEVKYPSWGRYLIRVHDLEGNHITGKIVYIDWPGWAGRAQTEDPGGAAVLAFSSDKTSYRAGEKVSLNIPAAAGGRALVSIESSGKILSREWVEAEAESIKYEFEATSAMTPNAYVHVTFLQPHMQTKNDLPIRMYGVIPIMVEDPETHLYPVIESEDVFRPEEEAFISISEASGKPMVYTLAIVDEGLLGLTRFQTPDPWSHFYRREAIAVKTWDLYDMVASAYGGVLEQLLAIGGGDELESPEGMKAKRFPPMVRFLGPFKLSGSEKQNHRIDVPQYVGAVRIMCVGAHESSFGHASKEVYVRKPIMVLGTLPRVLSVSEEAEVPVSVFVLEEGIREVAVRIETGGSIEALGPTVQRIRFEDVGDKLINFRVKTAASPGKGKISIKAEGGAEKASHTIELNVRIPSEPVVDVHESEVPPGQEWSASFEYPGIPGTNSVTLEVSRIPPLNLTHRLSYLIHYPHGCIEQVTSSVFPQLYLDKLLSLDPVRAQEVQKNVEDGITRIRTFQTTEGGFSYWPGTNNSNEWASSYAGHFLLEAEKRGYAVPPSVLDKWIRYLRMTARSWTTGSRESGLQQAYRLYCLALSGKPSLGAMNRLRENGDLLEVARWRLAAAYYLTGQPEIARALTATPAGLISAYRELSGTFGSDLRDKAMVLEAAVVSNQTHKAEGLIEEMSRELAGEGWLSTQTTAYALLAMAKYAGFSGTPGSVNFSYIWKGGERQLIPLTSPLHQVLLLPGSGNGGSIMFKNESSVPLYPRVVVEGLPEPGMEKTSNNGLVLTVTYHDMDLDFIDAATFEQGTDIVAVVKVYNPGHKGALQELALSHLIPSGWEIHNARLDNTDFGRGSQFKYQDIRDDRVYTYFDLAPKATKTFYVLVNASYLGSFYLPLISVEAMYDASINARIAGQRIKVKRPGVQ
jgi:uncharacterized protein YfaS (alpha-2-macroglobulin family)